MLIGVFSDVHGHPDSLGNGLELFSRRSIETTIFRGDFRSPIVARAIARSEGAVHCVTAEASLACEQRSS